MKVPTGKEKSDKTKNVLIPNSLLTFKQDSQKKV